MKAKLKERLDVFTDAIIAILITIMVLELPISIHAGVVDYPQVFKSIGIYLVSFCFIANLWYQHAIIFNEAEEVPNRILVMDLGLMFFLSLIPTFTRLMTTETSNISVALYGCLCLIISMIFRQISKTIIHDKYTDKADMRKVYSAIYGNGYWDSGILYLVLSIVGYFWPHIALVFFIIIPIRSFIVHSIDHEEFSEIRNMDETGIRDFVALPASDQRKFKRLMRNYLYQANKAGHNQTDQKAAWQQFSQNIKGEFDVSDETLGKWFNASNQKRFRGRGRNRNYNNEPHKPNGPFDPNNQK